MNKFEILNQKIKMNNSADQPKMIPMERFSYGFRRSEQYKKLQDQMNVIPDDNKYYEDP